MVSFDRETVIALDGEIVFKGPPNYWRFGAFQLVMEKWGIGNLSLVATRILLATNVQSTP